MIVKGLVWRSHLDRFQFSESENLHLGEEIEEAGGECLLDMRVRPGGSHHQKLVVCRYPGRPELDVAFAGGIDLCHSRRDDAAHRGDPQPLPMAAAYGRRPPWHDIQLAIRGPAVGDLEACFRERWNDPAPLSRSPLMRLRELARREDTRADPLPPQAPDPEPCGTHTVQVLRTYPNRLLQGYDFAPDGERSIARGYRKALGRARALIYLEDQYLWSAQNPIRSAIPRTPSPPSRRAPPPWTPGTATAAGARGRQVACVPTTDRTSHPRPGRSAPRCTAFSSTRTAARSACGAATSTDCPTGRCPGFAVPAPGTGRVAAPSRYGTSG